MEKIMAVYDIDTDYAERFADVVNQKEKMPFTVVPFTSPELLEEFAEKHQIEILLINSRADPELTARVRARSVVSLAEGRIRPAGETAYPSVYKYQSADSVIRDVMTCYCGQPVEDPYVVLGRRAKVIGVYSPVGRCLKTSMCLIMGQQLAREGKTLYLGFDEFSGLERILGTESGSGSDLSDVIYFFRQGDFHVMRLRSLVYTWRDMDYIAPIRYPEDLEQMSGEEAGELIDRLASGSGYGYVIVDAGRPAKNLVPILSRCDVIFMPVKNDAYSSGRIAQFEEYLRETGREDIRQMIRKVDLPPCPSPGRGQDYMDQILCSETGDYVRKLLRGVTEK